MPSPSQWWTELSDYVAFSYDYFFEPFRNYFVINIIICVYIYVSKVKYLVMDSLNIVVHVLYYRETCTKECIVNIV